jgi:hypothetical protein
VSETPFLARARRHFPVCGLSATANWGTLLPQTGEPYYRYVLRGLGPVGLASGQRLFFPVGLSLKTAKQNFTGQPRPGPEAFPTQRHFLELGSESISYGLVPVHPRPEARVPCETGHMNQATRYSEPGGQVHGPPLFRLRRENKAVFQVNSTWGPENEFVSKRAKQTLKFGGASLRPLVGTAAPLRVFIIDAVKA